MKTIKILGVSVIYILLNVVVIPEGLAQKVSDPDQLKKQLDSLAASNDPDDRRLLNEKLKTLSASKVENEMAIAAVYYYQIKNAKAYDSVHAAQLIKFPKGLEARIRTQQKISLLKSLPEIEKAYNKFIKDFPPKSYPALPFGEDRLPYDKLRSNLANRFAKEKNVVRATYYAGLLEADFWKVRSYGDLANTFYQNGNLVQAAFYQKKAVDRATPYAAGKMGNSVTANFAVRGYAGANSTYAQILYEQKKYTEALRFIEVARKASKLIGAEQDYLYARILAALGRNKEAYNNIEKAVKSGEATSEMAEFFKVLYVKVKGSNDGLELYEADIRKGVSDNLRKTLTKNLLNTPAVNFTLSDLEGNRVTLSDLKGKIVILDFWATWCVPCKASFPGMQLAVDKYKNDPNVQFLFIHTWERTPTPIADAKAYLAGMNYNLHVLMDTEDLESKTNKVLESYNVSSIPAKFVIDGEGNIRFKLKGFNGSKEAAVDEISMMIEMVRVKN